MDGLVNWEATSSDGDRFNQANKSGDRFKRRGMKCFEEYLEKKERRQKAKNLEKIKKVQEKNSKLNKQNKILHQVH